MKENEFNVAGVTFEGRQNILKQLYHEYYSVAEKRDVMLVPEPDNKFDTQAVKVEVLSGPDHSLIGYVPRPFNVEVLELLKKDAIFNIKLVDISHVPEKEIFSARVKYEKRSA